MKICRKDIQRPHPRTLPGTEEQQSKELKKDKSKGVPIARPLVTPFFISMGLKTIIILKFLEQNRITTIAFEEGLKGLFEEVG